jgi:hypothetical protein
MVGFGNSSHPEHDGVRSHLSLEARHALSADPVSRVLKWVLLAVAVGCLGMIVWASTATYNGAPLDSNQFVAQTVRSSCPMLTSSLEKLAFRRPI